jgi:hypothetical protein
MAKKSKSEPGAVDPKRVLRIATVAKPCLVGVAVLTLAQAYLPHSL